MTAKVFAHPATADHALLDSGAGERLERYGPIKVRRPDPQALWRPRRAAAAWEAADLRFFRESDRGGRWKARPGFRKPGSWEVRVGPVRLLLRPTAFKHLGLFPEQAANWAWVEDHREAVAAARPGPPRLLNLFAYTGAATVLAARAGWHVTHVDASRVALDWAAENARLNALSGDAVRWIADDAAAFAAREVRRGRRYQAVLVDPPHYGRGPRGEKWQFETGIVPLLESCRSLLEDGPALLVLSTYAIGFSPLACGNLLQDLPGGEVECGELALPEEEGGRRLPCGCCARWWRL